MMLFAVSIYAFLGLCSASSFHLRPREKAPDFKAKAVLHDQFIDVKLSDFSSNGLWTVLLFYPFDFTFVCPTEIISFSEHVSDFEKIKAQVLAISTDSHHTHLAWVRTKRQDGGIDFTWVILLCIY